jgi:hypothetical protein
MKIVLTKSGGFIGIKLRGEFDTKDLIAKELEILRKMGGDQSNSPLNLMTDQYTYELNQKGKIKILKEEELTQEELQLLLKLEKCLKP